MKKSHIILIILLTSFFISGSIEAYYPQASEMSYFIHTFTIAIMLFWWVGEHSNENHIFAPKGSKLLSGFIAPIGLPYYFFKGFGFKSGLVKLILCILILVLCVFIYSIPFYFLEIMA